jgi:3-deoxy-7-phosphoheptulonate synthase
MLIVMDKDATEAQIRVVVAKIESLGFEAQPMPGGERVAIAILRNPGPVDPALFVDMPGVIQAIPVSRPYKLVSREMNREDTVIRLPGLTLGRGHFVVIAGPCAVESETQALTIAQSVKAAGARICRYHPDRGPEYAELQPAPLRRPDPETGDAETGHVRHPG